MCEVASAKDTVELKIDVLRELNSSPPAGPYLINVGHLASYIPESSAW
jgi:hypothetical protein